MAVTFSGKDKLQKYLRCYIAGYDLSGDGVTFGEAGNAYEEVDLTGWDEDLKTFSGGQRTGGLSGLQMIMNATANRSHDRLKAPNQEQDLTLFFGGGGAPAIGDPAFLLPGNFISSEVNLTGGKPLYTGEFWLKPGVSNYLNPMGRTVWFQTNITAAVDGDSIDWGTDLPKTNGAYAIIQVYSAGTGALSMAIEHSTDDSSFSTLMSFTIDGTAVETEYISTASTVNQYTRFSVLSGTSTGCNLVCALAINNVFQTV